MRILANPIFLRAAIVMVCAGFSFLLGIMFVRALRKNIAEEANLSEGRSTSLETLPLNLYNTVIQQLKQQKHELQVQSQAEFWFSAQTAWSRRPPPPRRRSSVSLPRLG